MTNKEIEKIKQELYEIQRTSEKSKQLEPIEFLAKRIEAPIPPYLHDKLTELINEIIRNIHIVLQTETMLNACVSAEQSCELAKQSSTSAKWACIWAAVAAGASVLGAIAACIAVFRH